VGQYRIRPVLSLERLSFDEKEGKVCYRYAEGAGEPERMDYLESIARVTSHIPDKGQVTIRSYGLYSNAHRGKIKKAIIVPLALRMIEVEPKPVPSESWSKMIRKIYEVDAMVCPSARGR
jgi:hypothetical protein